MIDHSRAGMIASPQMPPTASSIAALSNGDSSPNTRRVGRDGFLELHFQRRADRTVLTRSRFTLPLQALEPLILEDGAAYLMLLNPTGGLVGGDYLQTTVVQGPDTHVVLTTPSATKVYRTLCQPAVQETIIRVSERAVLEYLPDHVIPHAGSAFRQSLCVEMEQGSCVILTDALAAGRIALGEFWDFREFESRISVTLRGTPLFINHTRICPRTNSPQAFGKMEKFHYMASLIAMADGFDEWEKVTAEMEAVLRAAPDVFGGTSLMAQGGCLVRFLAFSAPDLSRMTQKLWAAARRLILRSGPFDQRKY